MLFFVARRLLYLVPVLIAVSLLTFLIASLLPGDLAYVILGDQATPEKVAALRHDMGLDQPICGATSAGSGTSCRAISAARSAPDRPCCRR